MTRLRYYTARIMTALAAVPLIALFSAGSSYAFTDMNDSAAQAGVVKSLQKRIDSLEVRFEKGEMARNEEKKMAVDWNRGGFIGFTYSIQDYPLSFNVRAGYMIGRKYKNGRKYTISPVLDIALADSTGPESDAIPVAFGIQQSAYFSDRVTSTWGAYLHTLPSLEDDGPKLWAIGWGLEWSLDFWLDEKNTFGFGWKFSSIATRHSTLQVIYTSYFAKHNGKTR